MSDKAASATREPSSSAADLASGHPDLVDARRGDDAAFGRLVAPLRGELHAHCYRMLGSTHDAEDALQEALVRAWRGLGAFEGRSSVRTWLYTVATRTCLDAVAARGRRALPMDLGPSSPHAVLDDAPLTDVAWLTPYPDSGLGAGRLGPEARYEQREAVELALVAALQHLPGNQRAALLLFEVLGFSAGEIADVMATSVAAVNSALQRARAVVAAKVPPVSQHRLGRELGDARMRSVATRFATALEAGDADALVAMLTEDVTWSMPPLPGWYRGREAVADFAVEVPLGRCGSWRHLPVSANGQQAVALYLRRSDDDEFEAWSVTVLTLRGERIAELTSFLGTEHAAAFGLPAALP